MNSRRANITFWITVVSFIGSALFVLHIMLFGTRSPECEECVEKLLYYQHKADSLENLIHKTK